MCSGAGEAPEFIPGSSAELELELDLWCYMESDESDYLEESEWRPRFLIQLTQMFLAVMSTLTTSNHPSPFAERFKYDVISSPLLAVSLPSSHGRTTRSSLPGHLNHSRTPSTEMQHATPLHISPDSSYLTPSLLVLVIISFSAGYRLFAIVTLAATVYTSSRTTGDSSVHDISPSLESLSDLIASSNEWESVVQEAISTLEHDEQITSYASSPYSPSSYLRIALQSSLQTTETQCDNIRHLFSALTSPSELAQLSEMYAPPSPMKPAFSSHGTRRRPLSLPARRRTLSMPSHSLLGSLENNRSTWSGSHKKLPPDSPIQLLRRREKRYSDLSSIVSISRPLTIASAPVSPIRTSPAISPDQSLPLVNENDEDDVEDEENNVSLASEQQHFGAAALELHRSRKKAGMEAFKSPPPTYFSALSPPSHNATPSMSPGSRYTSIQSRHHLSLTALKQAVQGAMASRRYACSHLLALRFGEEEDEGYWEDVRSVMGLLTSTLVDASSRLTEALEYAEREKMKDQNPTPALVPSSQVSEDEKKDGNVKGGVRLKEGRRRSSNISFAPLPSHLSRFAAHVEAITTALDDARDHLQECVASLREEQDNPAVWPNRKHRPQRHASGTGAEEESHALQAYERLRRELGLAFRECERGKERLLDAVFSPDLGDEEDDEQSADDLPGLGHDASDDSDKPDLTFPFDEELEQERTDGYTVVAVEGAEGALDDATSHLLLTASTQHLPPPGIEQVFEADTGGVMPMRRERSKLTREERVKLMKMRRESGGGVFGVSLGIDFAAAPEMGGGGGSGVEKWGPGGEVVQELKDVIWKVGERRRKMAMIHP